MSDTNSIAGDPLDDPILTQADIKAVCDCVAQNLPIDPAVAARVRARSLRASQATLKRVGYVTYEDLMRPLPNEE